MNNILPTLFNLNFSFQKNYPRIVTALVSLLLCIVLYKMIKNMNKSNLTPAQTAILSTGETGQIAALTTGDGEQIDSLRVDQVTILLPNLTTAEIQALDEHQLISQVNTGALTQKVVSSLQSSQITANILDAFTAQQVQWLPNNLLPTGISFTETDVSEFSTSQITSLVTSAPNPQNLAFISIMTYITSAQLGALTTAQITSMLTTTDISTFLSPIITKLSNTQITSLWASTNTSLTAAGLTTLLQQLSNTQILNISLTKEYIQQLTAAQISTAIRSGGIVSATLTTLLTNLSAVQIITLLQPSTTNVITLTKGFIQQLTATQIMSTLNSTTPTLSGTSLTSTLFTNLSGAQIQSLIPTSTATATGTASTMSATQITNLFSNVTTGQLTEAIPLFISTQITNLTAAQITQLLTLLAIANEASAFLTATQLTTFIQTLTGTQIAALSIYQIASLLSVTQVLGVLSGSSPESIVQNLSSTAIINVLTSTATDAQVTTLLTNLTASQIIPLISTTAALATNASKFLTPAQIQKLTISGTTIQVATVLASTSPALTSAQLTVFIQSLTNTQIEIVVTNTSISGNKQTNVQQLTGAQLASYVASTSDSSDKIVVQNSTPAQIIAALAITGIAVTTTASIITNLTNAQISDLVPTTAGTAGFLTNAQLAILSDTQVVSILSETVTAIILSSAQQSVFVNALIYKQINPIVGSTTMTATVKQTNIQLLNNTQIKDYLWSYVKWTDNIKIFILNLTTAQVNATITLFTSSQVQLVTETQIKALTAAILMAVGTYTKMSVLYAISSTQVSMLTSTQLGTSGISGSQLSGLTNGQIAGLSATQLGYIPQANCATMSVALRIYMGSILVPTLASLSGLSVSLIPYIPCNIFNSLSKTQIQSLTTSAQITAISLAQIDNFTNISYLTPAQIGYLTNTQIQSPLTPLVTTVVDLSPSTAITIPFFPIEWPTAEFAGLPSTPAIPETAIVLPGNYTISMDIFIKSYTAATGVLNTSILQNGTGTINAGNNTQFIGIVGSATNTTLKTTTANPLVVANLSGSGITLSGTGLFDTLLGLTTGNRLTPGVWHNIIVIVTPTGMSYHLDGVKIYTDTKTTYKFGNKNSWFLGGNTGLPVSTQYATNVSYCFRPIIATEITAQYNKTKLLTIPV